MSKLSERIAIYQSASNYKLINRLPVITIVNGRSFSKLTSLLDKPYSSQFAECMCSTLLRLFQEIDGAIFGYSSNDEIIIISRNDHNFDTLPYYNNDIQKISSIISSISTSQFDKYSKSLDINLLGDPLFLTETFVVPSISEAINLLILKQQQTFQSSIQFACFYELIKTYNKSDIKEMLSGLDQDGKIQLLKQECGINYNEYPLAFRRGVACYKAPKIILFENNEIIKNKLTLDTEIPIFTKEHTFLSQILNNLEKREN